MKMPAAFGPLQARWTTLDTREQSLIRGAACLIALALLWWVCIAPALSVLRQSEAQQRLVNAQLQKMQSLQAQALALQSQPKISHDDALRALEASVKQRLGASAQFNIVGDRATVTLRNTPADALAQWLAQARVNAHAIPDEVRLVRAAPPGAAGAVNAPAILSGLAAWDGTVVLSLPAQ